MLQHDQCCEFTLLNGKIKANILHTLLCHLVRPRFQQPYYKLEFHKLPVVLRSMHPAHLATIRLLSLVPL